MKFGNLATKAHTSGRKDLERCFEIDIAKTFKIMQKCFGNTAKFLKNFSIAKKVEKIVCVGNRGFRCFPKLELFR